MNFQNVRISDKHRNFEVFMASRGAGRYLESFLELVASLWLSISPWRATAVQFMPIYVFFAFLRHQLSSKGNNQAGGIGWRALGESAGAQLSHRPFKNAK